MANNEKTDESVKRKSHETREAVLNDEHIDRAPRFQNVQDVLEHIKSDKTERAYRRKQDLIEDILSGQAREDREAILSQLLAELTTKSKKSRKERDLEENRLNPDWAKGAYPYVNRMRRKNYEEQKFRLQVELLKLQAWVKETGQKMALLQRLAAVRGRLSLCADQAAAAKWWLSMPMASVSAEGPMPKALSTRRTSPLMPGCRHQGRACPLRRARMTSNPLIVA